MTDTNRGVSRSMNSRAIRSPRAVRKRGDHPLAGVDRHIAEARLAPRHRSSSVSASTWTTTEIAGKLLDGRLDVVLERRRQRHRHAVIRPAQQLLADLDREIARAVDDRQDPDPRADRQEVVGGIGESLINRSVRMALSPGIQAASRHARGRRPDAALECFIRLLFSVTS